LEIHGLNWFRKTSLYHEIWLVGTPSSVPDADLPVEMLPPSQLNQKLKSKSKSMLPLSLASVVPVKRQFGPYQMFIITLEQVPLQGVYPTQVIEPWRCGVLGKLGVGLCW